MPKAINSRRLLQSINACVDNGNRLIDEAYDLEFRPLPATRYFMALVAQEEFAKAFILFLIMKSVIPMTSGIHRAMNNHSCKQLVGMIMDYAIMHWETIGELQDLIQSDSANGEKFPGEIGSAIEILRFEKIARWEGWKGVWAEDPSYEPQAQKIAGGMKDRRKQDALYVRLGRDGQIASEPKVIAEDERADEHERAHRYKYFVLSLVKGKTQNSRYEKLEAVLRQIFSLSFGAAKN